MRAVFANLVSEAIVICISVVSIVLVCASVVKRTLTPDCAGQKDVERRNILTPCDFSTLLKPLGVLVDHRIDDVYERLVGVEESVATAEDVAFKPTFDGVLRKHLHNSAIRAEIAAVFIFVEVSIDPDLLSCLVDLAKLVALSLIGTHDTERLLVVPHDSVEEVGKRAHAWTHSDTGLVDCEGEVTEVRQLQRSTKKTTIGNGVL